MTMEAGRELDVLVAGVIGWWLDEHDVYHLGDDRRYLYDDDGESLPYYSTDIRAAWELVEKFGLSLIQGDDVWSCGKHKAWKDSVSHPSAPMAICLWVKKYRAGKAVTE